MNFPSFGGNFQPSNHPNHHQMLNPKLTQTHDGSIHYQPSSGGNASLDISKYPCVSTINCSDQNEVKYVTAPTTHHQYIDNQAQMGRPYAQIHELHHDDTDPSKNISHRTESRGTMTVTPPWQGLVTPGVADYLARLPASALPLSLHHFLKFSTESTRDLNQSLITPTVAIPASSPTNGKKKTPKKSPKPYRPKVPKPKSPEIRLTTALDGSTLYCCPECHMAYPEKELLERHIQSHRMERRFVCDICGAGLKRKDHLTRHKQSHNPDRPYVCTICMKAFKRKEHLNLHFIMHSGEKTHVCTECGKGFYCKDHLDRHKQGHNPERPFICTICMKGFKRNEHLARHCIIHSGDKSQVCPECGKGFYRKDHLRKHLRSHVAKRVKTEQSSLPAQQQSHQHAQTVASLAAMVSMNANLSSVLVQDESALPLLSTAV